MASPAPIPMKLDVLHSELRGYILFREVRGQAVAVPWPLKRRPFVYHGSNHILPPGPTRHMAFAHAVAHAFAQSVVSEADIRWAEEEAFGERPEWVGVEFVLDSEVEAWAFQGRGFSLSHGSRLYPIPMRSELDLSTLGDAPRP